jgi:hypothetical protein
MNYIFRRLKFPFVLLFIGFTTHIIAQPKNAIVFKKVDSLPNIKLAYLGSITYPGFKLGLEFPIYAKEKTKLKANGRTKVILKERTIVGNIIMYHHPKFHTNWMLLAEWQMRRVKQNGWFSEFSPGIGYSRTILAGTTYTFDNEGKVKQLKAAGNNYFMMSLSGGFGHNFKLKNGLPFKIYSKAAIMIFAPYSSFVYPRPSLELGLITNLSVFRKKNR